LSVINFVFFCIDDFEADIIDEEFAEHIEADGAVMTDDAGDGE